MKEGNTKGLSPPPETLTGRRKKYVKPKIVSCSAEELLDRIGSARACSGVEKVLSCGGQILSP